MRYNCIGCIIWLGDSKFEMYFQIKKYNNVTVTMEYTRKGFFAFLIYKLGGFAIDCYTKLNNSSL